MSKIIDARLMDSIIGELILNIWEIICGMGAYIVEVFLFNVSFKPSC